jgi:hypothetical protein
VPPTKGQKSGRILKKHPRRHAFGNRYSPIFKYWTANQNRMRGIWNQPLDKYGSNNGLANFLPMIGASCNPAKGNTY